MTPGKDPNPPERSALPPEKPTRYQLEDRVKLAEEKGKKSEGIWDLDQAVMEKAEHAFSGQP
ncbi:hypothetical protein [Brevibacillus panacihumi]|uniref:Uncharacterized protein n=1 Tax=Brevibacillus panacihumi TaxID=497735 RepID=A0A3M8CQ78_9BACL|nr:hypothetical protein [Brevibacillus panacihumi]RNB77591.1 hypothetical protein EDM58_13985 [Brevibacillus panacihumi]